MKVQPINNYNYQNSTSFQGANKFCKYGIRTLIASASLFMLSNAVDTFKPEKIDNELGYINTFASVLGIAGTCLGIFGLEKAEHEENNKKD